MQGSIGGLCGHPVAAPRPKYERIGTARLTRARVEFVLPILIPGEAVYLYQNLGHTSPLADVIAGGSADLYDGTATKAGRISTSSTGKILILAIPAAPADACVLRRQFARHISRGEETPVLAFPDQARKWGCRRDMA